MATIPGATETASITWQAMTPNPGQTETLLVTWQGFAIAANGSQTIAGETVVSNGSQPFSATQVAEAAFGLPIAGLGVSGPTNWSVSAQAGGTTTLVSNFANQPVAAPSDQGSSGSGGTPTAVIITAGAAPVSVGTESIGGETVAGSGAFTAAQVAQVAGGGASIAGLMVIAEPTLWTVGPAQGAAKPFTSTTPNTFVAAPAPARPRGMRRRPPLW